MSALPTEDILAIQQLYAKYNHAIDFGDGAGWAGTFTPDGVFSSGTGTFTGTEQLLGFGTKFATQLKARHWVNNLVIEPAEGGASGTCYLVLWRLQDGQPPSVLTTGIYKDTLVKTGGGWKFSSRTVAGD